MIGSAPGSAVAYGLTAAGVAAVTLALAALLPGGEPTPDDQPPGHFPTLEASFPDPSAALQDPTVRYDGRFAFTRVRYGSGGDGFGRGWGRGSSSWAHDYPDADRNMQTMLNEFTAVRAHDRGSNVVDLEKYFIYGLTH